VISEALNYDTLFKNLSNSTKNFFAFINGGASIPCALVPKADRYEPVLTDTMRAFAHHYGCSVLPGLCITKWVGRSRYAE